VPAVGSLPVPVVIGSTTFDVSIRALVVGLVDAGPGAQDRARSLVVAGADLLEVTDPAAAEAVRAVVGVPVVVPDAVDGVVAEDAAALAVAIARGARVVRTHEVRAARRVADVLAAVHAAAEPEPAAP